MHVMEALDRFLIQLRADGRSTHTVAQYDRHVRTFAHWAGTAGHDGHVDQLDHEVVARFLASPAACTRSDGHAKKASSVNALRSSLKGFFSYLHRAGHLDRDPGRLIRRARCGPPPPRTLSDDEQRRLLDALATGEGPEAERDHALFHLMVSTGIRLGSTLSLRVEDVDLNHGEALVLCKGDREEKVVLPPATCDHLRRYIGTRVEGHLFCGRPGRALGARQTRLRLAQWMEKAGVQQPASPHALRHTFATRLYRRTGDVLLVKEALGHRSIASTLVYTKADRSRLRLALSE